MRTIQANKLYKHFKGGFYQVLNVAKHTETGEMLVVYRQLADETGTIYARPYDMFISKVDKDKYPEVEQEYRFEGLYNTEITNQNNMTMENY